MTKRQLMFLKVLFGIDTHKIVWMGGDFTSESLQEVGHILTGGEGFHLNHVSWKINNITN